ncbi:8-amino-7-oxononanoate synthase [Aliikangiella coralliicola]|uniref:8-amino-7-oxononanoate synthase n=2 Tax=Aliikangiella coralliicola TaxID=2592383 RepID=A0A545UK89_9GAMM|nr:8-amino-7-oxononanoate synthase [Aliikangiella coralliicola]
MKFLNFQQLLEQRAESGLLRQRQTLTSPQQTIVSVDGKQLINFASNDYLGLANQPQAVQALTSAADRYGVGAGASHLVCGHQKPHQDLEEALASFVGREAAITFSSGYMANLAILQCLAKKGDLIIADKLNHASLIDGVRLSDADSTRFPHCDLAILEKRLKKSSQNKFVVTDSVFSMDGDIAPLTEMVAMCDKYDAILIVDDAHGFGVIGENGKGSAEHFGLNQKQLPVLMATLGKALGGFGAFVSGEKPFVDYLVQQARSYIYTTAMPASIASANLANLNHLKQNPKILAQLKSNISYFRQQCETFKSAGFPVTILPSETAIQPIIVGDNESLLAINHRILEQGFLVGAIRPPTVPANSARLRITLSASHSHRQIDQLIQSLTNAFALQQKEVNQ